MGKVIGSILVGDSDFFLCPTFVITVLNLNLNSFSLGKSAQAGKGAMRLTLYKYIYFKYEVDTHRKGGMEGVVQNKILYYFNFIQLFSIIVS